MIYDHWEHKAIAEAENKCRDAPLYSLFPASVRVVYSGKRRLVSVGIEYLEETVSDEQVNFVKKQVDAGKKKVSLPFANENQKIFLNGCRTELKAIGVNVGKKNIVMNIDTILSLPSA